ncbi:hypothetical protein Tco_0695565 [Tanacetum coccineum]
MVYTKLLEPEILKKFDFAGVNTASTPIETQKPLVNDEEASDVDVHLYRSMIGSLMYLTASSPDIMFAICVCSRFQVNLKTSHLRAVKRIFRYLKGKPKLGLWYPRVSSFDLEAYSDSDYTGANLDRKSTTGGCQFLGRRLISWQCKKQTIVATSTTEAEYVAAANCCGQVLWIQNQMLDYGFNFMNTKIYIDNESTICIVKNPVFHSKTKHIAIRHHFIRDAYEKKLIQVLKIHTDDNVADLLTKAFDVNSLYEVFSVQKNLDHSDEFHGVIWPKDSTDKPDEGTDKPKVSTDKEEVSTDRPDEGTVDQNKGRSSTQTDTTTTTPTIFGDDETIAQVLIIMSQNKEKLKHNMVAYLEKTDVNAEFHEIIDFNRVATFTMPSHGKHFSGKVTPLFASMLVQPTEDEGATSERPSEPQPTPSPPHPSKANVEPQTDPSPRPSPSTHIPNSIPDISAGGNQGEQLIQLQDQSKEIKTLEGTDQEAKEETKLPDEGTDDRTEGRSATPTTPTTTPTMFGDDETIAQIDPKDKGKRTLKRKISSILEVMRVFLKIEKKFKQLARDEEMARKQEWKADRLLALRLQDKKERSSLWKREQSSFMIQLQLKEALYEKVKRFDESFTAVGSTEDERRINEINEGVKDPDQKSLKKRVVEETPKKEDTQRKRKRSQSDVDSNDEHRKCLKIITFKGTMNSESTGKKYLSLLRMLDLGLEVERESIAALDLIRFIKQQIDEN